jgi:nicotinate-nucleotide--dimethylbenzimidazole phosphoribosyltransferase
VSELEQRLVRLVASVRPASAPAREAARSELDMKTKPRGSLGRLEEIAAGIAAARGTASPGPLRATVVVAAADHGIAAEGVSAYPQEVTAQMLANFATGGAAVCVLAKAAGADLVVVDAGVATALDLEGVRSVPIVRGSANATKGPALTRDDAVRAVLAGADLAEELTLSGTTVLGLGEMGIANTTVAAALAAALLGRDPEALCGPGTGVDVDGVTHKVAVVRAMLAANEPDPADAIGCLAAVGGCEIGFLAGVALGGAARDSVVVLDGFISSVAGLVAASLVPGFTSHAVASHLSPEPGHAIVLERLQLRPVLDLGLRLGEGSGAALALPILAAARDILVEMSTFAAAGVTDTGR